MSTGIAASNTPVTPPMMKFATNPTQKHIGAVRRSEPPHIVVIQLNVFTAPLFCRRLLIALSCCWRAEAGKGTASAVPDTNDSARRVRLGIGRSDPAGTGSLA